MKNSIETIGNRTRDLPVCTAVPQPFAPPAACPSHCEGEDELLYVLSKKLRQN
jgi:hypothetical protein